MDGRKCLHCATDKTPQWRTGPMGPKTLCNACGVRYKSGREEYDELAELEWLSNFVEESFSSEDLLKLQLISGVKAGSNLVSGSNSSSSETRSISIPSSAGNLTAQNPSSFLPEASIVPGKARSKRSRAAPNNWSSRLLVLSASPTDSDSILLNPNPSDGRKCLHCATDKTPQWRTGPMGPKTLCNACGVRYKSG
ncbi:GATA transcription factor 12-like, partial [Asparagus officinalis]|uniref:GATA transcription factor 12-like n=1 Tax=Asparagus officinalis TaxID=4686 RepID=UPI00098E7A76